MKQTKRILTLLLSAVLVLTVIPIGAFTVSADVVDYLKYELIDNEVEITGYKEGLSGDITLPAEIEGYPVTKIGRYAFDSCSDITSVVIPSGVTYIDYGAFDICSSLTEITIPDSVTYIGGYTFGWCESLTSVTIPERVKTIGGGAFLGCESLKSIYIPSEVTDIGEYPFGSCPKLEEITVDKDNTVYHSKNNCLINTETKQLIAGCKNSVIPTDGSVEVIAESAFEGSPITTITIPTTVKYIDTYAFAGCMNLTSLTIPDSVEYLGEGIFCECTGLTSITIPEGVKSIGNYAFGGCMNLTSVSIPESVEEIGEEIFSESTEVTAKVYEGSYAEQYCIENGYNYSHLCRHNPVPSGNYAATCTKTGLKDRTVCSICNEVLNEGSVIAKKSHTYSNACDANCNVCNAKRTVGAHKYTTTTTKATTSKDGKVVKKCGVCGATTTTTIKKIKTVKLSATSYTYNGKAKKPSVSVKDSAGKTISSSNYTVSYQSGRKNVGKYKVTIKFKGNYSGTKTLYFTIKPVKTTVKSITAGKKQLKVNITKKSTQVTGYQIQYSTSKKFTSAKTKTINSYKTISATIKSLKAKKTYYVRVRTYKTVGKTKYYSAWSSAKSKKTK